MSKTIIWVILSVVKIAQCQLYFPKGIN